RGARSLARPRGFGLGAGRTDARGRLHSPSRRGRARKAGGGAVSFSLGRFAAMLRKEFLQMRRDPFTIALTVGMPLIQLFLFGYAINADPKNLPTLVVGGDNSRYERTLLAALAHTRYFELAPDLVSEAEASRALDRGE